MKYNFFKKESAYYPFRWYFVFVFLVTSLMVYANTTGLRLFSATEQDEWRSSGGRMYHK